MNILVAPNSMKGSLSAPDFAAEIEKGFRNVSPVFNVRKLPIADGGDHTGLVLCEALNAKNYTVNVLDPLGRPIEASLGISGDTAIIEMASASGLRLLAPNELNPEKATTFGTGQLIRRAIELGCTRILLGIGGSATVDGGIGMLDALGFTFFDKEGYKLPGKPVSLDMIERFDYPTDLNSDIEIIIFCDVNNPILGENGAARVFGPQKGADPEMVERLENRLSCWVGFLEKISGINIRNIEGMGAAGGLSSGLVALMNAKLTPGADAIFDFIGLHKHLAWADMVITGEGKTDSQSLSLKGPVALAMKAKQQNKPVIALSGSYEADASKIFDAVFTIVNGPITLEKAMQNSGKLVADTSKQIAGLLLAANPDIRKLHNAYQSIKNNLSIGNLVEAEKIADKIPVEHSLFWYSQGLIFQKRQQWGDALNAFSRALEIDPGLTYAQTNIRMIREIINYTNPSLLDP